MVADWKWFFVVVIFCVTVFRLEAFWVGAVTLVVRVRGGVTKEFGFLVVEGGWAVVVVAGDGRSSVGRGDGRWANGVVDQAEFLAFVGHRRGSVECAGVGGIVGGDVALLRREWVIFHAEFDPLRGGGGRGGCVGVGAGGLGVGEGVGPVVSGGRRPLVGVHAASVARGSRIGGVRTEGRGMSGLVPMVIH